MNQSFGVRHSHTVAAWTVFFSLIVVLRLILTGDRDILALNAPYDEFWFIHTASRMIWGGTYNHMAFAQLPVYSMWLAGLHLFGIPARLAIDLGWLLASGYLAFSLHRLTQRIWPAALCFVFLAFHPYTLVIFDRALAETLLSVLSAAVLGAGIELWNCRDGTASLRRKTALMVYLVGFALAFHTRKEGLILLAPLIPLAGWSWLDRKQWWLDGGMRTLAVPLLISPLIAIIALGTALASVNYMRWGTFARYELATPGYLAAMTALNGIDAGRTPRQVTLTAEARALAYRESPTFRELQPYFEGESGKQLAAYTAQFTGVPNEIGNGWLYWALREFAARAGWHKDGRTAETKYAAVAAELDDAFAAGRLKKRPFVVSAFIDPDFGKWAADVPRSVIKELRLVSDPLPESFSSPKENATSKQFDEFVSIAGRRNALPRWSISGWIIMPAGTLVGLGSGKTISSWSTLAGAQRPDVPGAIAFSVSSGSGDEPTELRVQTPDGKTSSVALSALQEGKMANVAGDFQATLGIDQLQNGGISSRLDRWLSYWTQHPTQVDWVTPLCRMYGWVGMLFWLAVAAAIAAKFATKQYLPAASLVIVLAGSEILVRAFLLGILDVTSWSGVQARYQLPVIPLFACMGVLSVLILSVVFTTLRQKHDAPSQG